MRSGADVANGYKGQTGYFISDTFAVRVDDNRFDTDVDTVQSFGLRRLYVFGN